MPFRNLPKKQHFLLPVECDLKLHPYLPPYEAYANMSTDERHDYAYDCFHHNACDKAEFMGIPEEIQVPTGFIDDEEISEWLSNEYGYCHEEFNLKALN